MSPDGEVSSERREDSLFQGRNARPFGTSGAQRAAAVFERLRTPCHSTASHSTLRTFRHDDIQALSIQQVTDLLETGPALPLGYRGTFCAAVLQSACNLQPSYSSPATRLLADEQTERQGR